MNEYIIHLLILVGIYLILAQSLNLVFGLGQLLNLAHAACYAIGAYTTAILSTELGMHTPFCILSSMAISGFASLIIGGISLKLSADYFAVGSLALSSVVSALLINWKSLTKGVLGIPGIPRPELFGVHFQNNNHFLFLILTITIVVLLLIYLVFNSRFGRSLRAISENELAAAALTQNPTNIRNDSFILASVLAGLAGSLFAYYINYVDPSSFGLQEMVLILTIVIVGKPGSFWGIILSTAVVVLLPEPLRFLRIDSSILGPMRQLLHALILFLIILYKRKTLFPVQRQV